MRALLVDSGNSSVKFALSTDGSFDEVFKSDYDSALQCLEQKLAGIHVDKVVVCSVCRDSDHIASLLRHLHSISSDVTVMDSNTEIPLRNRYLTPETLGMDRLAAALGAYSVFRNQNCLIFDFGTAITIDVLASSGEYLGGNISPGLSTRLKALNAFTGKLPMLSCSDLECFSGTGKTTVDAIASGVVLGIIFEVEGYIAKYPEYKVIFTGGDAFYFASKMKKTIFADCNLVLFGLSYIAFDAKCIEL